MTLEMLGKKKNCYILDADSKINDILLNFQN